MAKLNIHNELAVAASCDDALLRGRTVEALAGLSRTTLAKKVRAGQFPAPIRLPSVTANRWRASEVKSWIRAQTPKATP